MGGLGRVKARLEDLWRREHLTVERWWEFEMELDRFVMEYVGMDVLLIRAEHAEMVINV